MKKGKFITVEGVEGAGKSTALTTMQAVLEQAAIEVALTREPGGTRLAEEIRQLLLYPSSSERMNPHTELLLMFASRAQHLQYMIKPSLAEGKWVLSDRFVDASYAYQGGGRQLPMNQIQLLDEMTVSSHYPDLTLLLDIDPAIGCERAAQRNIGQDRIEKERLDFFERVREVYLARAKADPTRIRIIDASQDIETVHEHIRQIITQFMMENR